MMSSQLSAVEVELMQTGVSGKNKSKASTVMKSVTTMDLAGTIDESHDINNENEVVNLNEIDFVKVRIRIFFLN